MIMRSREQRKLDAEAARLPKISDDGQTATFTIMNPTGSGKYDGMTMPFRGVEAAWGRITVEEIGKDLMTAAPLPNRADIRTARRATKIRSRKPAHRFAGVKKAPPMLALHEGCCVEYQAANDDWDPSCKGSGRVRAPW